MTEKLLMPKATAAWLIKNTRLTFNQISEFVGMHVFEIQAMANGETSKSILPRSPISSNQLTTEEISLCEQDPKRKLSLHKSELPPIRRRSKGPRYTPLVKRAEKPDAIAWLVRHHPELNDSQITRLIGTTRPIIQSIRDRTHWNLANIKMRSPVELGLASQEDLDKELSMHSSDEEKKDDDKSDKDKSDKDKSDKEKSDKEKSDKDKSAKDKSDKEKSDKEKSDKDKSAKDKSDKEKSDKDKSAKDKSAKEKSDKEKSDKEKSAKDKSDKEKSDKDKSDTSKTDTTSKSTTSEEIN